jgi:hypothetical protein
MNRLSNFHVRICPGEMVSKCSNFPYETWRQAFFYPYRRPDISTGIPKTQLYKVYFFWFDLFITFFLNMLRERSPMKTRDLGVELGNFYREVAKMP